MKNAVRWTPLPVDLARAGRRLWVDGAPWGLLALRDRVPVLVREDPAGGPGVFWTLERFLGHWRAATGHLPVVGRAAAAPEAGEAARAAVRAPFAATPAALLRARRRADVRVLLSAYPDAERRPVGRGGAAETLAAWGPGVVAAAFDARGRNVGALELGEGGAVWHHAAPPAGPALAVVAVRATPWEGAPAVAALAPLLRVRPAPAPGRAVPPPPGGRYAVEGNALVDRVVGRRVPVRSVDRARQLVEALNRLPESVDAD